MQKGKKKTDTENVSAPAVTKTAQTTPEKKPRTTKAKAAPTDVKSADKPAKAASKQATSKVVAPTAAKTADKSTKKAVKKTESKTAAPKSKTAPKTVAKSPEKDAPKKAVASAPKPTPRKTTKGKGEQVILQGANEYNLSEIAEICKKAYRNGTKKQIKSIKVYVKAENNTLVAYYVVNDSVSGSVTL